MASSAAFKVKFLTAIVAIIATIAVNAVIPRKPRRCFLPIITNHIFADRADVADQISFGNSAHTYLSWLSPFNLI